MPVTDFVGCAAAALAAVLGVLVAATRGTEVVLPPFVDLVWGWVGANDPVVSGEEAEGNALRPGWFSRAGTGTGVVLGMLAAGLGLDRFLVLCHAGAGLGDMVGHDDPSGLGGLRGLGPGIDGALFLALIVVGYALLFAAGAAFRAFDSCAKRSGLVTATAGVLSGAIAAEVAARYLLLSFIPGSPAEAATLLLVFSVYWPVIPYAGGVLGGWLVAGRLARP